MKIFDKEHKIPRPSMLRLPAPFQSPKTPSDASCTTAILRRKVIVADPDKVSFTSHQYEKTNRVRYSLSWIDERYTGNYNFKFHHFKIGADIVCAAFTAEAAGSARAAKRVNSEES